MTRTPKFSARVMSKILERLAAGETLCEICSTEGMPTESGVRKRVIIDAAFGAEYARARDIGLDCRADRLLKVAADKERDPNCRRVEVDALKWYLCKLAPKKYGDKLDATLSGPDGGPVKQSIEVRFVGTPGDKS